MNKILCAAVLAFGLFGGAAQAQLGTTRLDHDVQKMWDNTFDRNSHGSRTNWERRRDADRRGWCRANRRDPRCSAYR